MFNSTKFSPRELLWELEESVSLGGKGQERYTHVRSVLAGRNDISPDDIIRHVRF